MRQSSRPVGELLRDWRQRRRLSQLDLALEAEISTRHLSYVETGRAQPSREMVLHLAERLEVPLRERNALLVAAGFAPTFVERPLDDPALQAARQAVQLVLTGHEPYPAIAVDRHWNIVAANRSVAPLMEGVAPELLQAPNALRLALHPQGLAPRIVNFGQWRDHLIARLHEAVAASADAQLEALMRELCDYPVPAGAALQHDTDFGGVVVPLQLDSAAGRLNLFSTITVFGTPVDITLSELAIEAFFPADEATARALRRLGDLQPAEAAA